MATASRGRAGRSETRFEAVEALLRVSEVALRRRRQLARAVGLTDAQWRALEEVQTEHFMPSLFARDAETSPAAVSRTLRQLQEMGLVKASIDAADARQRRYRTTAKGRQTIERLRRAREEALAAVWDDFSDAELERFSRFAVRLAEKLEAYAQGGAAERGADDG